MAKPWVLHISFTEDMVDDFAPRRGDLIEFEGRELVVTSVAAPTPFGPAQVVLREPSPEDLPEGESGTA